jgi:hypothetical protein
MTHLTRTPIGLDEPGSGGPNPPLDEAQGPSRRSLLQNVLAGGATLAVLGTGALGYRVFDTALLDPDHGHAFDAWGTWRDAPGPLGTVAAAILAANPHNTQPWSFRVTSSSVEVYADPARRVPAMDPFGRETHVGLGCAIENLVLAAQVRGLAPTVTLTTDGPGTDHVAHVAFATAPSSTSALYAAIGDRHSNRGPYTERALSTDVLDGLVDTTGLPGVGVHWVTDATARKTLGRLMLDAATAVTGDQEQSQQGFVWFRSSDDEIQRHRDGLTLDGQGLSEVMLTAGKLLPASSRTAGDAFWLKQTEQVHTATAAAYGVVTVPRPGDPTDPATALTGGRLLQRIHLTATARGVALQHMNQVTERIDRDRQQGSPSEFARRFADLLPGTVQPLVTFRVGYAARPSRLSPRRLVSQVT